MTYSELIALSFPGFLTFALGALPAGWLGDRWDRAKLMAVFFLGIGGASILTGVGASPLADRGGVSPLSACSPRSTTRSASPWWSRDGRRSARSSGSTACSGTSESPARRSSPACSPRPWVGARRSWFPVPWPWPRASPTSWRRAGRARPAGARRRGSRRGYPARRSFSGPCLSSPSPRCSAAWSSMSRRWPCPRCSTSVWRAWRRRLSAWARWPPSCSRSRRSRRSSSASSSTATRSSRCSSSSSPRNCP